MNMVTAEKTMFGNYKPVLHCIFDGVETCIFKFSNGCEVIVVRGPHTCGGKLGLWEVSIFSHGIACELSCDSPVKADVVGGLAEYEVVKFLKLAEKKSSGK